MTQNKEENHLIEERRKKISRTEDSEQSLS